MYNNLPEVSEGLIPVDENEDALDETDAVFEDENPESDFKINSWSSCILPVLEELEEAEDEEA